MVLKAGEKILFEVRRHWFVIVSESALIALLALMPFIALGASSTVHLSTQLFYVILFLCAGWLLTLWSVFFIIWTNYYLDVWIITDQRIIDIEQLNLFNRVVSEFRLDRVQDITIKVNGLIATILGFGDIHVQTAGEMEKFLIKSAPKPYEVKDKIIKEHDRAVRLAQGRNHEGI